MDETRQKVIKFHGTEVNNIKNSFLRSPTGNPGTKVIEEFNAIKSSENCETINVQVVADYVTMTFNLEESKIKERFSNRSNSYIIFKLFFNKFVLPVTLYRLR